MLKDKREKLIFYSFVVFLFLLIALLTKNDVTMAGNESSRFGTIQALAEQNTFALNQTTFRSVDHITVNGRIYSDKPLPLILVHGMMFKIIAVITGIDFEKHYFLSVYLTNLLGIGLLNIILFVLFFKRLSRDVEAPFASKMFLSASLPLGTLLLSYCVAMNNHTPAALLLFLLFMQLMDYRRKDSIVAALLIGLTAGALVDVEIPVGGLFGIAAFVAVLLLSKKLRLAKAAVYGIGGLLPIGLMGVVNYIATGQFYPQYIGAGGTYSPGFEHISLFGYFVDILFGNRGFFSYMPAMLFIFPVLILNRRIFKNSLELIIISTIAAIIIFYGLFTNEYGGWAYGFRYLIPIIPVVWYFIAREYAPKVNSWQYKVLSVLIVWGVATSYVGAYNPWCSAYEAYRSPAGKIDHYVRNTFAANLLCMSFENNPESALSRFLIFKVYGQARAVMYMQEAFTNTKDIEELARLQAYCVKYYDKTGQSVPLNSK
ncbi:MAG: hypothetical protein WC071_02710 [Victivallaceae bacterium]